MFCRAFGYFWGKCLFRAALLSHYPRAFAFRGVKLCACTQIALTLTLYFWLYLCVFKFLNDDDKVNQHSLTRKEKILLLCLNALFSAGLMLACIVVWVVF